MFRHFTWAKHILFVHDYIFFFHESLPLKAVTELDAPLIERDWSLAIRVIGCKAGGISRASAFVLVAKP